MAGSSSSRRWSNVVRAGNRTLDRIAIERVARLGARSEAQSPDEQELRETVIEAALRMLWPADPGPGVPAMPSGPDHDRIGQLFHRLYYYDDANTWHRTRYRGTPIEKCPLDLWKYLDIVTRLRPDVVVETNAKGGGSALLLADLCEAMGHGQVFTMGREDDPDWPAHPRITYWHGEPTDPVILGRVAELAEAPASTLVFSNSAHQADAVLEELLAYGPFVSPGSYLIVENTNIGGHPVRADLPEGPMEAVRRFLAASEDFEVDTEMESDRLTFNPSGYLRRRGAEPA